VAFLDIAESARPVIRLSIGESHIHAPTAALVYQLAELASGRITRVSELEQPVFACSEKSSRSRFAVAQKTIPAPFLACAPRVRFLPYASLRLPCAFCVK